MQRLPSTASVSGILKLSVRASSSANVADVTRPPYYRKPHQHHKPLHMLQEEFPVRYNCYFFYFCYFRMLAMLLVLELGYLTIIRRQNL